MPASINSVRTPRTSSGRVANEMRFLSSAGAFGDQQYFRHHAEHRATIEAEEPIAERGQLEIANLVPRIPLGRAAGARSMAVSLLTERLVSARRARRERSRDDDERHEGGLGARSRLLIDQAYAARFQLIERRGDIVNAQRDVVQAPVRASRCIWRWPSRTPSLRGVQVRIRRPGRSARALAATERLRPASTSRPRASR